jgi:hypothetical protein
MAEFCNWNDVPLDSFTTRLEIFEWYAIDPCMVHYLKSHKIGVIIDDVLGMTIWGRTCTGQSISMDHDIAQLWAELHPEELAAIDSITLESWLAT